MTTKQRTSPRPFLLHLFYGVLFLALAAAMASCLAMINTINQRMNESAASNLLNTTRVIQNAFEDSLSRDMDSLRIVGDFYKNGEALSGGQIDALCSAIGFDWIALVDERENGADSFTGKLQASDMTAYDQWTPGSRGYSDPYIGRTGRPQIALWVPIYRDEQYIGTVFGGVVLTKYYSANIFTFYDGEGRTYLFDGTNGSWILKSLGTDGTRTRHEDIYSLLAASGNREEDISAFRTLIEERRPGTAVLCFNGEQSYLCFLPLASSPDWYVTTVIAKDVLLRESAEVQRMIRSVLAILCVSLAFSAIALALWQIRRTKTREAHYREALFANLSANLDSAFLIYDKAGKKTAFVSDNFKRLLGVNRESISENAGRLFDWCRIPADDPQRTDFLEGTLNRALVREVHVANELGQNSRTIRLELIPADLGQQLAVLTDITSDKEIQNSLIEAMQRAEAASDAKNNFLSAMSHDLRTPINGIVGMTAIAAAHLADQSRLRDCLTKINESSAHLLSLINEVLDMSQIESGKIQLTSESFNLAELLQDVLSVNYPGIQQKNHTVRVHIHLMEHEEVIGDPVRITRVATNLISNAIKYTPSGGTITLTLREKEAAIQGYGCYELTVRDNGIGISSEFQKRLFTPFEREEDVRLSRIQGTGLGLSIVKSLVDLMMGSIQIESEKGEGATFRVTLNLRLNMQEAKDASSLAGLPVLVVDDDIDACETATDILCSIGMEGEWCDSGAKAIELVAARHRRNADYLAILLDWKMPEMDGLETARRIRAEVDSQIPIIILTAYEWSEIEAPAREAGVDAFLSKPIYKAKLLQKMTELTAGIFDSSDALSNCSIKAIPPGKRVLIAEDNELNKEIAVEFLRMMGVKTDCAEHGAAAVELFARSEPGTYDCILMDIQMPKMDGYEATKAIRSMNRPDSQTVPIIAMTADAFKKDEQSAHDAGMNAHLAKPVSIERLAQVLNRFLAHPAYSREETMHENS